MGEHWYGYHICAKQYKSVRQCRQWALWSSRQVMPRIRHMSLFYNYVGTLSDDTLCSVSHTLI